VCTIWAAETFGPPSGSRHAHFLVNGASDGPSAEKKMIQILLEEAVFFFRERPKKQNGRGWLGAGVESGKPQAAKESQGPTAQGLFFIDTPCHCWLR
jgi:hypothetical protein